MDKQFEQAVAASLAHIAKAVEDDRWLMTESENGHRLHLAITQPSAELFATRTVALCDDRIRLSKSLPLPLEKCSRCEGIQHNHQKRY